MKLKEARDALKLSQEEIAHMVGISLRHYQYIEGGKSVPSIVIGLRIAKILQINPYDIDWKE